jgi:methyltransferase-like protein
MREMVRRMMHYHSNQFESSEKRINQARALINFLASSTATDSYYGAMLQNELNLLQRCTDSYLFHEHLEEHNSPIYFYEFNERAKENNLQYLGESDFFTMINNRLPEEVSQTLEKISPDIIRREQYMDFLRNRFFRQTLLCHNHHALKRDISSEVLKQMLIASPLKPEPELVDFSPNKNQIFRSPNGFTINTDFPLTKAALTILSKNWPSAMHINTLLKEVHARIKGDYTESIQNQSTLLDDLLQCFINNVIELHTWQAEIVTNVSDKPKASTLATYQVTKSNQVVNQRHELVELDTIGKELVLVLDGSRDKKELLKYIKQRSVEGVIKHDLDGQGAANTEPKKDNLTKVLDHTLEKLAQAALLVD